MPGADIPPFRVMEAARAAERRERAGHRVLHLEIGQPSTPAPEGALRAAERALRSDRLGYTAAQGIPALRQRIARHYGERYGVDLDPDRVLLTAGASGGVVLAFLALFDHGARVAVCEPGYPCYRNTLLALGMQPVRVPVGPETRYQPTLEALDACGALDGLVVASPANPTGTALLPRELDRLADWCRERDVPMVADEIYHGITYTGTAGTALATPAPGIVLNSFSKYFSMTGWRLGWLVAPEEMVERVNRLAANLYICPSAIAQHAAVAAFECRDELEGHVARYAVNRRVLLDGLARAGIDRVAPADGAFYAYADTSHLADDSQDLCTRWLEELDVAATPGIDFDQERGRHHVRFSFCGSPPDIAEAVERLQRWCAGR